MHSLGRRSLALLLACALAALPAATAIKPLGLVVAATSATLSRAQVQSGTNVYPGDLAATSTKGFLQMNMGRVQVYLGGESEVMLQENDQRILIYLQKGTAGFTTKGEEAVLLHAGGAWVRAQSTASTNAEITLGNNNEFLVTSKGGPLELIMDDQVTVVPQDQSVRARVEADLQNRLNVGGKRRLVVYTLTGMAVAAIVTCAVLFNTGHSNLAVSPAVIRDNAHCK